MGNGRRAQMDKLAESASVAGNGDAGAGKQKHKKCRVSHCKSRPMHVVPRPNRQLLGGASSFTSGRNLCALERVAARNSDHR
jgi:hypothetical protein